VQVDEEDIRGISMMTGEVCSSMLLNGVTVNFNRLGRSGCGLFQGTRNAESTTNTFG
jgi:hypothetical protein